MTYFRDIWRLSALPYFSRFFSKLTIHIITLHQHQMWLGTLPLEVFGLKTKLSFKKTVPIKTNYDINIKFEYSLDKN